MEACTVIVVLPTKRTNTMLANSANMRPQPTAQIQKSTSASTTVNVSNKEKGTYIDCRSFCTSWLVDIIILISLFFACAFVQYI